MGTREIERRVEVRIVELAVGVRAELQRCAGRVGERLAAVAAGDLHRLLGEPPEARGDGAQRMEVAKLERAHLDRRASVQAQDEVSPRDQLG